MQKIMITGAAGFIGYHLCKKLLARGDMVVGIDNLNEYYDVNLKKSRLARLKEAASFTFIKIDLQNRVEMADVFTREKCDVVVNLAAQPGVRYSLKNPYSYVDSNISGFLNVLEGCRNNNVKHLIFASSSSVYGSNTSIPFTTHQNVDHPVSLYAATKKANELMAHAYSHLYNLPCTGLRFFTVYGPWGRPDMAYFLFTKTILEDKPIQVFNHGDMRRDFTYIDDIVEGIIRIMNRPAAPNPHWRSDKPEPASSYAPYEIFNIGNNNPVNLMEFIEVIEKHLGKKARKQFLPMQAGDVPVTYADIDDLIECIGFTPATSIDEGVKKFVEWYRDYYK